MNPGFPFPAVIARKMRKIIESFRQKNAVTPESAKSLEKIGLSKSLVMRRLIRRGVIMEVKPGTYYLNEEQLGFFNQNRQAKAGIVLLLILIALAIYAFFHLAF